MSQSSKGVFSVFKQEVNQINKQIPSYCRWTEAEDKLLLEAVNLYGAHKWSLIANHVPKRTPVQCSTRWLGALNPHVHKGRWSKEEDDILIASVKYCLNKKSMTQDNLSWSKIARNIPHRTGIQCQARWTEALDPTVRKGRWKKEEDEKLTNGIRKYGCCWIRVAEAIPGRTQRQSRTRWNQIQSKDQKLSTSCIKKKKKKQQQKKIKEVLDWKSLSQTLANNNTLSVTPIRLTVPDQTPYILLNQPPSNSITIPFDILSPVTSPSSMHSSSFKEDESCSSPSSSHSEASSIQHNNTSCLSALHASRILDDFDSSYSPFINDSTNNDNEIISVSSIMPNEFDFDPTLLFDTHYINQAQSL